MRVKEVLQRRDKLRGYLHSLSIAKNFCEINIANQAMIDDLDSIYKEIQQEFNLISESLKPFEDMDMQSTLDVAGGKMKINTNYHGEIEVREEDILTLVNGMLGFEDEEKF